MSGSIHRLALHGPEGEHSRDSNGVRLLGGAGVVGGGGQLSSTGSVHWGGTRPCSQCGGHVAQHNTQNMQNCK